MILQRKSLLTTKLVFGCVVMMMIHLETKTFGAVRSVVWWAVAESPSKKVAKALKGHLRCRCTKDFGVDGDKCQ